jgi:hypothetical protein
MVSLAGLADLARDAVAGTIRQFWTPSRLPQLTSWRIDPKLTVGVDSLLHIQTRYAGGAYLRALQADGSLLHDGPVAPNGHVGLTPLTPALVRLVLTLEPRRASVVAQRIICEREILPQVIPPSLKVEAPRQVCTGETLLLIWEAPTAQGVTVYIDDGENHEERAEGPAGVLSHRPTRPGPIVYRFVAQGEFAPSVEIRTIQVVVPAPKITIERAVQTGFPGDKVSFRWLITGAREAHLVAPARNERHQVPLRGELVVTIEHDEEAFQLIAVGWDERTRAAAMSAVLRLIGCLDEPND